MLMFDGLFVAAICCPSAFFLVAMALEPSLRTSDIPKFKRPLHFQTGRLQSRRPFLRLVR